MSGVAARAGFLGALAILVVTSGCFGFYQHYISETYPQYLIEPLPKAPRPLAREIRYTWVLKTPDVTLHSTDRQTEQRVRAGTFSMPKPSRSGSEVLQSKADYERASAARSTGAASRQAHRDNAVAYSHASEAALRTEMAMGQAMAAVDVLNATLGLFAALGEWADAAFRRDIEQFVRHVQEDTGAVGPEAPPGTVLYLQFYWHVERRTSSSYLVSATLDRGHDQVFRSDRNLDSESVRPQPPEGTPPPKGFVLFTPAPLRTGEPFYDVMILMARSAVAELYRQLPGE